MADLGLIREYITNPRLNGRFCFSFCIPKFWAKGSLLFTKSWRFGAKMDGTGGAERASFLLSRHADSIALTIVSISASWPLGSLGRRVPAVLFFATAKTEISQG
jgi:hypothetical protein